jgi:SAM-dependent methyltransferase
MNYSNERCVECGGVTENYLSSIPTVSDYRRCRTCRLIIADYCIEDSGDADNDAFREDFIANIDNSDETGAMYSKVGYEAPDEMTRALLDRVKDILQRFGDGNSDDAISYLEVGCANGFLVDAVKRAYPGSQVIGVDPSPVAREKVRSVFDVEVIQGTIKDVPAAPNGKGYDIIVIFGNLQLHPNPIDTIRNAYSLLRPGGLLAFDYKNPSSTVRQVCRVASKIPVLSRTNGFARVVNHAMRHIRVSADKGDMQKFVKTIGFELCEVSTFPPRLLAFKNREAAFSKGLKGVIWRSLEVVDRARDQRAWVQFVCRKP